MAVKSVYRVRNWREYNRSVIDRGNITIWLSDQAIAKWKATNYWANASLPKNRESADRGQTWSKDTQSNDPPWDAEIIQIMKSKITCKRCRPCI